MTVIQPMLELAAILLIVCAILAFGASIERKP